MNIKQTRGWSWVRTESLSVSLSGHPNPKHPGRGCSELSNGAQESRARVQDREAELWPGQQKGSLARKQLSLGVGPRVAHEQGVAGIGQNLSQGPGCQSVSLEEPAVQL